MPIDQQIKTLRKSLGLNQTELAKKSNISQSDVSEFENGVRLPSYPVLERIAKALGADVVLKTKRPRK
ncbi:helix-turn-helix domain-containing protein [Croceimicrobium sp.]|uniref:helix-turn-helix domain-containing protein n=1 Tax=Croceimicrobium sp. TaxID=2828340 RepID=UPI003BA96096